MKHDFYTAGDFKDADPDSWGVRNIAEGGLAVCKVCGGGEGSLTTDCPGEKIPYDKDQAVYAGKTDYREGQGWVSEKNPTNQAWEYGAAYKHAIDMQGEYSAGCFGYYSATKLCSSCGLGTDCESTAKIIRSYEARKGAVE